MEQSRSHKRQQRYRQAGYQSLLSSMQDMAASITSLASRLDLVEEALRGRGPTAKPPGLHLDTDGVDVSDREFADLLARVNHLEKIFLFMDLGEGMVAPVVAHLDAPADGEEVFTDSETSLALDIVGHACEDVVNAGGEFCATASADEGHADTSIPNWVKSGGPLFWWSESQQKCLEVGLSEIDQEKRHVVVHFKSRPEAWKSIPFSLLGQPNCPLKSNAESGCVQGGGM